MAGRNQEDKGETLAMTGMGNTSAPISAPLSDRELVLAFQNGDAAAYDDVYRRYVGRVRRICSRILQNPQDVDEATQETFLKAYQALGRFNGQYQLGAWLARIASNICVDHVRLKVRSASLVALTPDHESLGIEGGPEDSVIGQFPRLDAAITEIQPLHAQALKLRALGGYSHEEMAGQLSMTSSQVKALLHRARTSFKRAWDKAEGWALAPLAGLRAWTDNRSAPGADTGSLVGASPAFGPMLFERVATSAVIVVVALTSVPAAPLSPSRPAVQDATPAFSDLSPVRPAETVKLTGRARGRLAPSASAAAPKARRGLIALPISILGGGSGTLRPSQGENPHKKGSNNQGGIGAAETAEAVGLVRDVAETVRKQLPRTKL